MNTLMQGWRNNMAITKTGQQYFNKEAGLPILEMLSPIKYAPKSITNFFTRAPIKGTSKATYNLVKILGKTGLKTSEKLGKNIVYHPGVAIPLTATAIIGAAGLRSKIRKNMIHTDPNMNATHIGIGNRIPHVPDRLNPLKRKEVRYNNPMLEQYLKHNYKTII